MQNSIKKLEALQNLQVQEKPQKRQAFILVDEDETNNIHIDKKLAQRQNMFISRFDEEEAGNLMERLVLAANMGYSGCAQLMDALENRTELLLYSLKRSASIQTVVFESLVNRSAELVDSDQNIREMFIHAAMIWPHTNQWANVHRFIGHVYGRVRNPEAEEGLRKAVTMYLGMSSIWETAFESLLQQINGGWNDLTIFLVLVDFLSYYGLNARGRNGIQVRDDAVFQKMQSKLREIKSRIGEDEKKELCSKAQKIESHARREDMQKGFKLLMKNMRDTDFEESELLTAVLNMHQLDEEGAVAMLKENFNMNILGPQIQKIQDKWLAEQIVNIEANAPFSEQQVFLGTASHTQDREIRDCMLRSFEKNTSNPASSFLGCLARYYSLREKDSEDIGTLLEEHDKLGYVDSVGICWKAFTHDPANFALMKHTIAQFMRSPSIEPQHQFHLVMTTYSDAVTSLRLMSEGIPYEEIKDRMEQVLRYDRKTRKINAEWEKIRTVIPVMTAAMEKICDDNAYHTYFEDMINSAVVYCNQNDAANYALQLRILVSRFRPADS